MGIPGEETNKRTHERSPACSPNVHLAVLQFYCVQIVVITVAGSADAQVGEVGGQAARAVGRAEGREGHGVLGVQWGGQRRRELDVCQIRKRTTGVVCSWEHRGIQLLVW